MGKAMKSERGRRAALEGRTRALCAGVEGAIRAIAGDAPELLAEHARALSALGQGILAVRFASAPGGDGSGTDLLGLAERLGAKRCAQWLVDRMPIGGTIERIGRLVMVHRLADSGFMERFESPESPEVALAQEPIAEFILTTLELDGGAGSSAVALLKTCGSSYGRMAQLLSQRLANAQRGELGAAAGAPGASGGHGALRL